MTISKEKIQEEARKKVKTIEAAEKRLEPVPRVFQELMKEKGINGYQLEKGAGFTRQTIQNFTTSKRGGYPSLKVLSKACVIFDIKLSDFFKRVEKCSS